MLIPTHKAKDFKKYGFKKCKGEYGKHNCYYLCVSRGANMLFVSDIYYSINDWTDSDPRIHKYANCKYKDHRDAYDITFELIKDGYLISENQKRI